MDGESFDHDIVIRLSGKVKKRKKKLSKKEEKALVKKIKAKIKNGEALESDEEDFAYEKELL